MVNVMVTGLYVTVNLYEKKYKQTDMAFQLYIIDSAQSLCIYKFHLVYILTLKPAFNLPVPMRFKDSHSYYCIKVK